MGRSTIRPGDTVRLSADPAALHLFDPESGNRIG
jgi:multiple sugar transport system ATP-binding protein